MDAAWTHLCLGLKATSPAPGQEVSRIGFRPTSCALSATSASLLTCVHEAAPYMPTDSRSLNTASADYACRLHLL